MEGGEARTLLVSSCVPAATLVRHHITCSKAKFTFLRLRYTLLIFQGTQKVGIHSYCLPPYPHEHQGD
jgi:hypothetical protein